MSTIKAVAAADGTIISYVDYGPADGRPIVLLHGLGASGRQFAADAEYFAAQGYRVLVPDIRGHGRSGTPAGYRVADFAIPVMAADMLAVLDDAGVGPVDWVGNSLGGILALSILGTAPERLRSLTTFGTAYRLGLPALTANAIPWLYRLAGRRLFSGVTGWMTTPDPAARKLIGEMLYAFDPQAGRAVAENVRRYDLTSNAMNWTGPMLLIRGGKDRQVNLALRGVPDQFSEKPNWQIRHLPAGGHCANLDVPGPFRQMLLEFWS